MGSSYLKDHEQGRSQKGSKWFEPTTPPSLPTKKPNPSPELGMYFFIKGYI